ncbi:unnamed protein product, partial [Rotaria sp. Silwood1]
MRGSGEGSSEQSTPASKGQETEEKPHGQVHTKRPRGSGEASSEQSTPAPKGQETEEKPHGRQH